MPYLQITAEQTHVLRLLHKQDVCEGGDGTRFVDRARELIQAAGMPLPTGGPILLSMPVDDPTNGRLEWTA